jgi:hypothetical protein
MSIWATIAIAIAILAVAAPYVAWVRHPRQRPFAAYLLFVSVFALAAVVLFVVIGWLIQALGLAARLGQGGLSLLLILLGVVPALLLATWEARQPPGPRRPPG